MVSPEVAALSTAACTVAYGCAAEPSSLPVWLSSSTLRVAAAASSAQASVSTSRLRHARRSVIDQQLAQKRARRSGMRWSAMPRYSTRLLTSSADFAGIAGAWNELRLRQARPDLQLNPEWLRLEVSSKPGAQAAALALFQDHQLVGLA